MFRLLPFSFGIIFFGPICASVAKSKGHNGFGGSRTPLAHVNGSHGLSDLYPRYARGTPEYLELVAQSEAR